MWIILVFLPPLIVGVTVNSILNHISNPKDNIGVSQAEKSYKYSIVSFVLVSATITFIIFDFYLLNTQYDFWFAFWAYYLSLLIILFEGIAISSISLDIGKKSIANPGGNIDAFNYFHRKAKTGVVLGTISLVAALLSIAISAYYLFVTTQ